MRINSPKPTKKSKKVSSKNFDKEYNRSTDLKKVMFLKATSRTVERVPEDEKENYWYTATDVSNAYENKRRLRKCMSSNKHVYRKNQSSLNSQGVFTEEQARKKDIAVEQSHISVFREMQKQKAAFLSTRKEGKVVFNDDKIAEAYHSHSQVAMEQARRRAKQVQDDLEDAPITPKSPFSPARLFKKRSASPKRFPKSIPSPSVYVAEQSPSEMFNLTTPAA